MVRRTYVKPHTRMVKGRRVPVKEHLRTTRSRSARKISNNTHVIQGDSVRLNTDIYMDYEEGQLTTEQVLMIYGTLDDDMLEENGVYLYITKGSLMYANYYDDYPTLDGFSWTTETAYGDIQLDKDMIDLGYGLQHTGFPKNEWFEDY